MKLRFWYLLIALGFCALAGGIGIAMHVAQPAEDAMLDRNSKEMRAWELYAKHQFADLNKASAGQLEELFDDFTDIMHARMFIRHEKTREIYQQFLVGVIEDAIKGDVAEAMFKDFVLEITPPDTLLEAVVPELGPKGRLHGILETEKTTSVRERLERQSPGGYPGEPDFRHYAFYLEDHKDVKTSPYLIRHMFRTAPGEALHAMMYVHYRLRPYPLSTLSKRISIDGKIRPVFLAEHIISDVIWHEHFRFDLPAGELTKAKTELSVLSQHKDWWVRLYAAEIVQQHPELRVPDIIERLQKDENEFVRQAITREGGKPAPPQRAPAEGEPG